MQHNDAHAIPQLRHLGSGDRVRILSRLGRSSNRSEEADGGGSSNPMDINVSSIYTSWSKWSRCRRSCKQVRRRECAVAAICGAQVLTEERACAAADARRCSRRRRRGKSRTRHGMHIVKKKKLSRRTRGMLKFNRGFYSRWSKWSQCSKTCKTTRTR